VRVPKSLTRAYDPDLLFGWPFEREVGDAEKAKLWQEAWLATRRLLLEASSALALAWPERPRGQRSERLVGIPLEACGVLGQPRVPPPRVGE